MRHHGLVIVLVLLLGALSSLYGDLEGFLELLRTSAQVVSHTG